MAKKEFKPGQGFTKEEWDDTEFPELTDEELAEMRPFAEVLPELAASIRRGRGPNKAPTKRLISLRLSGEVIDKYKAGGDGWQSRIDADLRKLNKIK
ncbi:BrnA antitoxin family protein [Rhodopseudomonas sp. RCAM05734]|uniref:BrnA antitoxin family protein n=1 Tax=Rhodopseudomonas sp. RCAM05734 TaxID=3457549 RepID=UPI004044ADBF